MTEEIYNKTDNVMRQVASLKSELSDGKTMSPDEIKTFLGRKWITSVLYYLGEEVKLETVKDGRKILGYYIANGSGNAAMPRKVSETVSAGASAAVPAKRAKVVLEDKKPTSMKAVVTPASVPVKPRPAAVVKSTDNPIPPRTKKIVVNEGEVFYEGIDLTYPSFLVRKE